MFDDVGFDRVRERCNELADIVRDQGPFEPHRLSLEEMEYTTLPGIEKQFRDRWEAIPGIIVARTHFLTVLADSGWKLPTGLVQ